VNGQLPALPLGQLDVLTQILQTLLGLQTTITGLVTSAGGSLPLPLPIPIGRKKRSLNLARSAAKVVNKPAKVALSNAKKTRGRA